MSTSSQTTDVVAAVREVTSVAGWAPAPYSIVANVLRDDFGYNSDGAHAAIFEAVMEGAVVLDITPSIKHRESLCLETEDVA